MFSVGKRWLSLQEKIDLALHHLTTALDWRPVTKGTILEGLPFCLSYMGDQLTELHCPPDFFDCPGRYLVALSVCLDSNPSYSNGRVSGDDAARHLVGHFSRMVNQDGKGEILKEWLSRIDSPDQVFADPVNVRRAKSLSKGWWDSGRGIIYDGHVSISLEGLVRWFRRTGDPDAKATIDRSVRGRISDPNDPMISQGKSMVLPGIMTPLTIYYETTGDESTKAYLDDVASAFLEKGYLESFPDGTHSDGFGVGHLHSRLGGLAGFIRYSRLIGRADYIAAAEALVRANTSYGTEFGWMPERRVSYYTSVGESGVTYQAWAVEPGSTIDFTHYARPRSGWDTCEICVTADAIDCAIELAKCGYEQYWDIAERYLNHLFEGQITDDSFLIDRHTKDMPEMFGAKFEGVAEDLIGSYLSFSSPTWATARQHFGRQLPDGREGTREGRHYGLGVACCHGFGARSLGLVWHHIVTEEGNQVEVNFPFDRKTDKVEVKSHLPFTGHIRVTALKPIDLFVRIPDWVNHAWVDLRINGKKVDKVEFKNSFSDYVKVGKLKESDVVDVCYPLRKEKKRYHIEYHPCIYEAEWLGNYVMGMEEIKLARGQGDLAFTGIGKLYQY